MRRAGGWVVCLLGVMLVIVGLVGAIAFGPDDRVTSQPTSLSSRGIAVVTAPTAITYSGPTVELTVTRAASDPVFLGVGHDVDVRDYLSSSAYAQVDSVDLSFDVTTREIKGTAGPEVVPEDVDWWIVADSGKGSATVTLPLPDAAIDVVVTAPDVRPGLDVTVTAAVVQQGAFVGALALGVGGLGLAVVGWMIFSSVPARGRRRGPHVRLLRPDKTRYRRSGAT